ncbi:MAG TPA: MFS transporter, partial [Iamia sp.]
GLLTAFQFGPVLLLGAWAGSIADRSDKRKLLIRMQTLAMVQSLAFAAIVFSGHATVGIIYALAAVQGVITAFDNPARRAFVVEMVPKDMVANAVSLNSTVMTGSRIVGPAAAGLLVVTVGFGWAFLVDGLSYIAVIYGLLLMRSEELHPSTPTAKGKGQVVEGLRYVRSQPDLFVPLVMMAAIGTFAFNFQVTIPLLVTGPLGGGDGTFTILFSVLSLGSMAGALWTARRTEVDGRQIIVAAAGFGVTMLLLALAPTLWASFPAAILLGIASIAFMTTSTAIVQMRAAPEYRGRVLALQAMVFLGSTPIGGPTVGLIIDSFGPRSGVAVGGLACLAAAAWGHRALRRPDELVAVDADTAEQPALTLTD